LERPSGKRRGIREGSRVGKYGGQWEKKKENQNRKTACDPRRKKNRDSRPV